MGKMKFKKKTPFPLLKPLPYPFSIVKSDLYPLPYELFGLGLIYTPNTLVLYIVLTFHPSLFASLL